MSPPLGPNVPSTETRVMVDVLTESQPPEFLVHWSADEPRARLVEPRDLESLRQQLEVLHRAEREKRTFEIPVARRAAGEILWAILDGPERRLTRALKVAEGQGEPLDLVVRLRTGVDAGPLARHEATR